MINFRFKFHATDKVKFYLMCRDGFTNFSICEPLTNQTKHLSGDPLMIQRSGIAAYMDNLLRYKKFFFKEVFYFINLVWQMNLFQFR
jgi:hypothetical protein